MIFLSILSKAILSLTRFIVLKVRLKQFWGYYLVLTACVDNHFDPLFVNPLCDGTVPIGREYRFFTLVILAVFRPVCTRFRIQAADLHKSLFSLIKPGLDCATFVRSMSISSTTSLTAERFHLWPLRRVDLVALGHPMEIKIERKRQGQRFGKAKPVTRVSRTFIRPGSVKS